MNIVLPLGLFASLMLFFALLVVPSKYGASTVNVTVEKLQNKAMDILTPEHTRGKLAIVNKTAEKVMLDALTYGLLFGAIGFLLSFFFLKAGILSLLVAILFSIIGVVVGKKSAEQAYTKWQGELFEGIPTLINFFPAFIEVEGVTPKDAMTLTLPFLPEPLKSEMWHVLDEINRTHQVDRALNRFADRAKHSLVDAICFRLASAWNSKVTPDIFDDLADQVEHIKSEAAQKRTTTNTAFVSLLAVLGSLGIGSILGYPAIQFITGKFGGF